MKHDLITIFNQLTSSELADYTLFSDIIEKHYEKFRYLYSLINRIDLNKVKKIDCKATDTSLKVFIEPYEIQYMNETIYDINAIKNNYSLASYFDLDLREENGVLIIKISMSDDREEVDIYADRFI